MRLGVCLTKLLGQENAESIDSIQSKLDEFESLFYSSYYELFRRKLGLSSWDVRENSLVNQREILLGNHTEVVECDDMQQGLQNYGDDALLGKLFQLMKASSADFTNMFRALIVDSSVVDANQLLKQIQEMVLGATGSEMSECLRKQWEEWCQVYAKRVNNDEAIDAASRVGMQRCTSPKYIPRNYQMYAATKRLEHEGAAENLQAILSRTCSPFDSSSQQTEKLSDMIDFRVPIMTANSLSTVPTISKERFTHDDLGTSPDAVQESFVKEWNPYTNDGRFNDEALCAPATLYKSASKVTQLSCSS